MDIKVEKDQLKEILFLLGKKHPWFYSEASFRHSLSSCIFEYYKGKGIDVKVIQEYSFPSSPYESLDILVVFQDKENICCTAIELKYKTKDCAIKDDFGEFYLLKKQGAQNISMYLFWKDVYRLEHFCLYSDKIKNGYAIFLTNDDQYLNNNGKGLKREEFAIFDGREIVSNTTLHWKKNGMNTIKEGYEKPIHLKGEYSIKWNGFSSINESSIISLKCCSANCKKNSAKKTEKFDIFFLEVDSEKMRNSYLQGKDLFTSSFINAAAEAEFDSSTISKAKRVQKPVYVYIKEQFDRVQECNRDNESFRFSLSDKDLKTAVENRKKELEKIYFDQNADFKEFIAEKN